jgi:hypothetical protein
MIGFLVGIVGSSAPAQQHEMKGSELRADMRKLLKGEGSKKGEDSKKGDASRRWMANADSMAGFHSSANPTNWPLADLKAMLHSHLDLTSQEVVAHLGKDWGGSVAAYDRIHEQILIMADALSAGIIKQFPQKVVMQQRQPSAPFGANSAHGPQCGERV